ncbi:glycosyltransferase family 2 protein [Blastochloris viridis]|uniref:Chondroitin polymerase n=1 Tax=Blastochloris viridis TaxID=1079 RepID=A0A0H5BFV3_BLAVI|nr:glycosyltransferase family 2 protein [Blastochloris viridis]ALK10786.1 GalNAc(5)-diNAcBac-PP-undecaprenol beta-1,3-glucosyltransferase [Blastochloris viridis]BAR99246.1 glycosyltransferase [Blastochloris viridis]CUU43448.1 Chondroitin polymerase [Blastochloris viridis]
MDVVSIVVPTLNRPQPLQRAIASTLAQAELQNIHIEIVVVDNSAEGSAQAVVTALPAGRRPVRYLREPNPGVANARNAGVRAASGRWVAFLDDDEEASPNWVAQLVAVARRSGAAAVFGPVEARAEEGGAIGAFAPYFSRRIDRADASDITDLSAYLGTNNSMFERERCFAEAQPFDAGLNEVGGEDSLLLKRLARRGLRFAWAANAGVLEWVPPRRLTWGYVWRRKFLSGQIRVFVFHMLRPVPWPSIALWMTVGLVQLGGATAAALIVLPFRRAAAARLVAVACGGLGKLLWMPRFRQALYGTKLVS